MLSAIVGVAGGGSGGASAVAAAGTEAALEWRWRLAAQIFNQVAARRFGQLSRDELDRDSAAGQVKRVAVSDRVDDEEHS
jgi:hypothetical protein